MKEPHVRLKFSSRIYLSLALVFISTILSTEFVAWIVAGNQAMARAERTLDQSLQKSEFDLEQEESDLSTLGKWLVNQNQFVALVRAHDSIGLARMLEPLTLTGIIDVLIVSDASGQVTIRVREKTPITQGDNILSQTGIREALSGKSTNGLEPDELGQLRGRFTLPIYDDASRPPIGVLVVGFYLDGPFFQRMSSGMANQAIIVYDDRVAITNLAEVNGEPGVGQTVPDEVTRAEREGRPSGIVLVANAAEKYLFEFRPLHFPAFVPAGMYGVGISSHVIESERDELFRAMAGAILLIAVAVNAGAFAIARALTMPIQKLQTAARGLAQGNLSEPLALARDDELGDLAILLERIRERLRAALEPESVESKPILCGEIMLDPRSHRVTVSGRPVTLSAMEFKLLQYLIANRDTVVGASQIIANVWGYAADEDDDVVRMTISRLRRKIESDPARPEKLITSPGAGYMLRSRQE